MGKSPKHIEEQDQTIVKAYSRFVSDDVLNLIGKDAITSIERGDNVEKTMSILFADIRGFTTMSENMTPQENFDFINAYLNQMEPVIVRHGGLIDKYIGDAIMALFRGTADNAVKSAIAMLEQLRIFNQNWTMDGKPPIRIGIGINTGIMMFGIIGGSRHMESTVISDAVNLASRMETLTKNYDTPLLITEHTYYSLNDTGRFHTRFIDRVKVKGKQQCQSVYEVFDADPPELRQAKLETKYLFEEALAHYHLKDVQQARDMLVQCLEQAPNDRVAHIYLQRCDHYLVTGIHESSGELTLDIHWHESFATGNSEIDDQHRLLFENSSNFINSVKNGGSFQELQTIMDFLGRYVAEHFETEEKIMTEAHYPFLQLQVEQHQRFSNHLKAFVNEMSHSLENHRAFMLFRTQILLIDWLVNHTSGLDRHFGRYLASGRS